MCLISIDFTTKYVSMNAGLCGSFYQYLLRTLYRLLKLSNDGCKREILLVKVFAAHKSFHKHT